MEKVTGHRFTGGGFAVRIDFYIKEVASGWQVVRRDTILDHGDEKGLRDKTRRHGIYPTAAEARQMAFHEERIIT